MDDLLTDEIRAVRDSIIRFMQTEVVPKMDAVEASGVFPRDLVRKCGEAGFYTNEYGLRGAMLRAYDKMTGEEMGAVYMPAPQSGAPMTYMLGGRQYVVIAIGGGNYSAELIAFRLPGAI